MRKQARPTGEEISGIYYICNYVFLLSPSNLLVLIHPYDKVLPSLERSILRRGCASKLDCKERK
uniref:Uncharacterized protein n=1 Tax=Picea glauca TaxID=3330 RepID=A0A101M210_PICGL|nr:hypothetical protein ABT39_MTgene4003 [Picea glauca]